MLVTPIGVGRLGLPGGLRLFGTRGSSLGGAGVGAGVGLVEGVHGRDLLFDEVGVLTLFGRVPGPKKDIEEQVPWKGSLFLSGSPLIGKQGVLLSDEKSKRKEKKTGLTNVGPIFLITCLIAPLSNPCRT